MTWLSCGLTARRQRNWNRHRGVLTATRSVEETKRTSCPPKQRMGPSPSRIKYVIIFSRVYRRNLHSFRRTVFGVFMHPLPHGEGALSACLPLLPLCRVLAARAAQLLQVAFYVSKSETWDIHVFLYLRRRRLHILATTSQACSSTDSCEEEPVKQLKSASRAFRAAGLTPLARVDPLQEAAVGGAGRMSEGRRGGDTMRMPPRAVTDRRKQLCSCGVHCSRIVPVPLPLDFQHATGQPCMGSFQVKHRAHTARRPGVGSRAGKHGTARHPGLRAPRRHLTFG